MFFAGFLSFRVAQGMGVQPFFDIIGQTIPATRVGAFFAYRSILGGILVLASGWLIVQPILRTFPSPTNYGLLIVLGTVIMIIGWGVFTFSHELPNHDPPTARTTRETLATGWRQFQENTNFRLIIVRGFLTRINVLAIAFYVPYSVERFGAERMAGMFLGMFTLGKLLSSWVWGRLSDRKGNRLCLLMAGCLFSLNPFIALVASFLPDVIAVSVPGLPASLDLPLLVYASAIFFFGLAFQGDVIAQNSFLLENAAPERRASYRAVFSTFLFPMTVLPAVTGILVRRSDGTLDVFRCQVLFGVLIVSGLLSMLITTRIREIRQTAEMPSEST